MKIIYDDQNTDINKKIHLKSCHDNLMKKTLKMEQQYVELMGIMENSLQKMDI